MLRPLAQRWLRQADGDLQAARISFQGERFEWTCFQAQQCAEKALRALLYHHGRTSVISHSAADLILRASALFPDLARFEAEGKFLDNFYLATRYPHALNSERAPVDYYTKEEAERCLSSAESILTAVKSIMPG